MWSYILRKLLFIYIFSTFQKTKENQDKDDALLNGSVAESKNNSTSLSWLSDLPIKIINEEKKSDTSSSDSENENFSTLRELLIRPSNKPGSEGNSPTNGTGKATKKTALDILDDVLSSVNDKEVDKENELETKSSELKHFIRRYHRTSTGKDLLPTRIMTLSESKVLYPDTPHSWLCDGKLLRLHDPNHTGNYRIFQVNYFSISSFIAYYLEHANQSMYF